jgi:hypothetical protein
MPYQGSRVFLPLNRSALLTPGIHRDMFYCAADISQQLICSIYECSYRALRRFALNCVLCARCVQESGDLFATFSGQLLEGYGKSAHCLQSVCLLRFWFTTCISPNSRHRTTRNQTSRVTGVGDLYPERVLANTPIHAHGVPYIEKAKLPAILYSVTGNTDYLHSAQERALTEWQFR